MSATIAIVWVSVTSSLTEQHETGTAREFGTRRQAPSQANKNPHSDDSPIWMTPGPGHLQAGRCDAAKVIKDCAKRFNENSPLPNTSTCKITRFTGSNEFAPPMDDRFGLAVASWGPNRLDLFGVGTDGAMYHKAWDGIWRPSPSGWEHLGGVFTSPPAVVASGVRAAWMSSVWVADRSLFHKAWAPDTGWTFLGAARRNLCESASGRVIGDRIASIFSASARMARCITKPWGWGLASLAQRLGASAASLPARLPWSRGDRIAWIVFGLGSRPQSVPQGVGARHGMDVLGAPRRNLCESAGGRVVGKPNRLDIFGVGTDGAMYHKAWDGAPGVPHRAAGSPLGGVFTSPPAVVAWGSNCLDVFGLGTDRSLFHKAWAPDTGWTLPGNPREESSRVRLW